MKDSIKKKTPGEVSFFISPNNIPNIKPATTLILDHVFAFINGDKKLENVTSDFRSLIASIPLNERSIKENKDKISTFKRDNFDFCTFSGVFTEKNGRALVKHSNMLCIEIVNLTNPKKLEDISWEILPDFPKHYLFLHDNHLL